MKKRKVFSVDRRNESKASTHVIIEQDRNPLSPLHDFDQVFLFHSNIPREMCGNECDKGYENPLVEIEDEDGYGTGTHRFRDGVIAFPVSAYIHSGIALRMGSIREFPCDPGGWDTTPNAAYLWTDRKRFEEMCGPWMELYDEEAKSRRKAKDEAEFREYLWKIAKGELELLQKYIDGECFGYREETRIPFKKVYPDGHEVDDCDWDDGDSCWGFYVDSIDDIDFPKDEDVDVFDDTGNFVGDTWTIPELVVIHPDTKLYLMTENGDFVDGHKVPVTWTQDLSKAKVFRHWNCAYNAFVDGDKRLWAAWGNGSPESVKNIIKDKDELK